mgnify:FL=1
MHNSGCWKYKLLAYSLHFVLNYLILKYAAPFSSKQNSEFSWEDFDIIQQIAMEVHAGSEPEQNIEFLEGFLTSNRFVTRTRFGRMLWVWREKAVQRRGN